jgi:hypothetical protein
MRSHDPPTEILTAPRATKTKQQPCKHHPSKDKANAHPEKARISVPHWNGDNGPSVDGHNHQDKRAQSEEG